MERTYVCTHLFVYFFSEKQAFLVSTFVFAGEQGNDDE